MSDPRWLKVAALDELKPGDVRQLRVLARSVAVFNIDGRYWAIDGLCRHMHAELVRGDVHGTTVKCNRHGWEYEITDGSCLTEGSEWATLRTYTVEVKDDSVYVDVAPIYHDIARHRTG